MDKKQSSAEGIIAAIRERIAHGETVLQIAGIVREVARQKEGQKVTKRLASHIADRVRQIMPGTWAIHYAADGWGAKVDIWCQDREASITHGSRLSFTVARWHHFATRDNQDTVSEAWIVAQNACYFLEAERLPVLRSALESGKPAQWAGAIRAVHDMRNALRREAEAFGVQYLLDI